MDIQVHFFFCVCVCVCMHVCDYALGCETQLLMVSISFNYLKFLSMDYTLQAHFKCTP